MTRPIPTATAAILAAVLLRCVATSPAETRPARPDLDAEWRIQFHVLGEQVLDGGSPRADRAYHKQATILDSDRHPVDVVLRRTEALLDDLAGREGLDLDVADCRRRLAELKKQADALPEITRASIPSLRYKRKGKDRDIPPPPKAGSAKMGVYRQAFTAACELNRRIALANPLLDFDRIVFVQRHPPRMGHMCDQWFGMANDPGGGLFVLEDPFGDSPRVTDLTANAPIANGRLRGTQLHEGIFASPEVSYDGRTVWFAWSESTTAFSEKWARWHEAGLKDKSKKTAPWGGALFREDYIRSRGDAFHIMKIDADGRDLVHVTDGAEDDHSPCVLPNGRIAFVSTRRGGEGRCHPRPCPTYVLHSMLPDGSDIEPLSYHEINEWTPRVNNEGDIIYSRWDYVDRNFSDGQHPWIAKPDGRNARALYGNWENQFSRGRVQADLRAIPDSSLYVGVLHSHHCSAYGTLLIYDRHQPDDPEQSCIRVLTPDIKMEPSRYASPYPLDDTHFLCVWSPDATSLTMNVWKWYRPPTPHGVYVLDKFGNRTLLYRDDEVGCKGPLPLRPRKRPPVQPHMVAHAYPPDVEPDPDADPDVATLACMDVYESRMPWPKGTKIKAIRIVQVYPKTTPRKGNPPISLNVEINARGVIGTVPVEPDGSVHFTIPSRVPVYFQALDANGCAVQSMKSNTYAMPGETLLCQGCHEPVEQASPMPPRMPLALRKAPVAPEPAPRGAQPMSFVQLVQPVLDAKCVDCHAKHEKAPDLSGRKYKWYTAGYENLSPHVWCVLGNGWLARRPKSCAKRTSPVRSIPGELGALDAPLYKLLTAGSHKDKVKLTDEEMLRITMWLDNMSVFFSAYHDAEEQKKGVYVKPTLE